jgi:DnaJ-class molecular chaperone
MRRLVEFLLRKQGYELVDCRACDGRGKDYNSQPGECGDGSWAYNDCDTCDGHGQYLVDGEGSRISFDQLDQG